MTAIYSPSCLCNTRYSESKYATLTYRTKPYECSKNKDVRDISVLGANISEREEVLQPEGATRAVDTELLH